MKIVYIQPAIAEAALPLLYTKPDTAIHNRELPLYLPDFTADLRGQAVLLAKISKQGKCIAEKFAFKYYEQVGLALALTAYDRQQQLQAQGRPWELATAFDGSMIVGNFMAIKDLSGDEAKAVFTQNEVLVQEFSLRNAIQSLPLALHQASEYVTLRTGDLVALPLAADLYPIEAGTTWEGRIEATLNFSVEVK